MTNPNPGGVAVAVRHLERLSAELRGVGLTAVIESDRQPFPAVLVTAPAASVVIRVIGQGMTARLMREIMSRFATRSPGAIGAPGPRAFLILRHAVLAARSGGLALGALWRVCPRASEER
jgi:hypothetical protein